jgi:hypothetical protein
MPASIIWAWHFGQVGRLMRASGTMDDRARGCAIMLPSKERECNTRDHRFPVQRAELQPSGCPFAVQYCSVSENCFLLFSGLPLSLFPFIKIRRFICKKGPRGFRRRSKSGRKRPGKAATAGTIADLVLQIKKPRALTGLNLAHASSGHATFTVDASYRDADHLTPCSRRWCSQRS